jgi:phosphopantetheinyl transferase
LELCRADSYNVKGFPIPKRKYLSIHYVKEYDLRLKTGEKKRDLERCEVMKSLQDLGFDSTVLYKESGQPYLEKYPELFLSISHSNGWIAVYVSQQPVGIDIETENPRMIEGASYFLNENEQKFKSDLNLLSIIWGSKEAFYKWKEGKIQNLKNDVTIHSIKDNHVQIEFEGEQFQFEFSQKNGITVVLN